MRAFFIVFPILALISLVVLHGYWAKDLPFYDAGIWLHPAAGALLALFFSLGMKFSFFRSVVWIILAAVGWEIFELVYYAGCFGWTTIPKALGSWRDILGTTITGITILFLLTKGEGKKDDHVQS